MSAAISSRIAPAAVIVLALLAFACPARAGASHAYDQSGTVISMAHDPVYRYRVESADKMYTMLCYRARPFQFKPLQCDWNGRHIAVGDAVRFRIKGDRAFMPANAGGEERFIIEMAELKELPRLPTSQPGNEGAVVLGLGFAPEGNSTPLQPSSTSSSAPVVAIPTTGGPPVVVIPTAPATGSVVTGIPATGGAPITAVAVAPTSSSPGQSGPSWIHILRLETESNIYDLACGPRACRVNGNLINQGDALSVRLQKKWAYVSASANLREERFAIISVRPIEDSTTAFPRAN